MRAAFLVTATALIATPALAGPPYVTDDPEPTDLGKWEIYAYGAGTRFAHHATEAETGFDINYGAARGVQLTATLPVGIDHDSGRTRSGVADVELGAKYLFVRQRDGTAIPDIGLFPRITLPTARKGFGAGKVAASFPFWAQKDFGKWSLFGGGGYAINPGKDARNSWFAGYALTRQVTGRLNLGAELYHQTKDAADGKSATGAGIGVVYDLSAKWSLLASGGPMLQHRDTTGHYAFYLSLAFHD